MIKNISQSDINFTWNFPQSLQNFTISEIENVLINEPLQILGAFADSSNATFLTASRMIPHSDEINLESIQNILPLHNPEDSLLFSVYKPERGERSLHDFPRGLHIREYLASYVCAALGWGFVPYTLIREDGPYGIGSVQLFIPHDYTQHYFTIQHEEKYLESFQKIALFDFLSNNADRKSGHVILGNDGEIYAIDHGLCFHSQEKLRTIIWDFEGQTIPDELLEDIESFYNIRKEFEPLLTPYLDIFARDGLYTRIKFLLDTKIFPSRTNNYQYPWPLI